MSQSGRYINGGTIWIDTSKYEFECVSCGAKTYIRAQDMGEYPWSWQMLSCLKCGDAMHMTDESHKEWEMRDGSW